MNHLNKEKSIESTPCEPTNDVTCAIGVGVQMCIGHVANRNSCKIRAVFGAVAHNVSSLQTEQNVHRLFDRAAAAGAAVIRCPGDVAAVHRFVRWRRRRGVCRAWEHPTGATAVERATEEVSTGNGRIEEPAETQNPVTTVSRCRFYARYLTSWTSSICNN